MVLIDTHTLVWFMYDSTKLSDKALSTIQSVDKVFVSIASLWELSLKMSLNKIDIAHSIQEIAEKCKEVNISVLSVEPKHLDCLRELPSIHKDPFDRLLVAQAIVEDMTLITKDAIIPQYDVKTLW